MNSIDRVLRSNLKLKHLQLLVALDQLRHLGKTAEFLAITQPAVSKTLAEIERLFDLTLFTRSTRGTEPTPQGESVVRFARSVLSEFERTKEDIASASTGASGRTNVGAMVVALPTLLSPAIERVKKKSAQMRVMVEEGDLTRLLPRLRRGELDVLVGRLEPGYAAPDLSTEPLYQDPMCLVVSTAHPLTQQKKITWDQLARQAWVVPPPWASSRLKLEQIFHKNGLGLPSDLIESASFLAILCAVNDHHAVGFVARGVGLHFQKEGLLKVLPVALKMDLPPVGMITMRGQKASLTTQTLMTCLRDIAKHKKASRP
ncbi:LysR family transcriptional regulator [Limnohabitans sp. TS-CS-82]|uniref:LysR substrate-binding domain-containing protein n=1 Tax=Limnohabitans sp. TS-CS-82 TaxID=2094193 RepID=UPI000CF27FCF|nr:LysR substrate-binding domain-containing protein [Limnohabitans sp. TS-CS-82]PQA83109.1 LysR family transcriptional regulator [Limnohabitans sp. TS-CS-82]